MPTTKKKPAKRKPAPKKAPAEKLSQIEAALAVLAKAKQPMNAKEMIEAMTAQKLWSSPAGKTPAATLNASIHREIATRGKDARFKKAAPGRFVRA